MAASRDWSDEDLKTCLQMWENGATASEIGLVIKRARSAVCGKIHRLRSKGHQFTRPYHDQSAEAVKARVRRIPSLRVRRTAKNTGGARRVAQLAKIPNYYTAPAPSRKAPPVVVDATHAKPWLERTFGECAFPITGQGAETFSCCAPARAGHSYCKAHRRIMFRKPPERLERLAARIAA